VNETWQGGAQPLAELSDAWPRELSDAVALVALTRVDSTQRLARQILESQFADDDEPRPFAIVALEQSAGRGRRGRAWESRAGLGVWASLVLPVAADEIQSVPMRVAVALVETVNRTLGGRCRLKWPNDLVVDGAKLGGLLVDAISRAGSRPWAIAGFGINHGHAPGQHGVGNAVSLRVAAGSAPVPSLAGLAVDTLRAAWGELESAATGWLERYRAASAHLPGDRLVCDVGSKRLAGRFVGFDRHGFLQLETAEGVLTVRSGEVFQW
jgi:BirA family biotin operon repressor/biotin-[acetyl-CoA-carboxylase] ligase